MGKCQHNGCKKGATFGENGGVAKFCKSHKMANMVDVKNKRCEHPDCISQPVFDVPGEKGRFCVSHKTSDMIDVKNKRCEHPGCDITTPAFDIPGGKGRFCVLHKTSDMVNVLSKRCEHSGCISRPSFDIPGGKGRFCKTHKTADMTDVKNKRCKHPGCISRPTFDVPGGKGRFCVLHKTSDMVNVLSKRCEHSGCISRPSFDIPGGKGRFCVLHKTADMVDVKNKRCEHPGCNVITPRFNLPGTNSGRFCATHKTSNMIDVKNKQCEKCPTRVRFGIPGHPATHCFRHKQPGMIRHPNARCKRVNCKSPAIYGTNWTPTHCEAHKTPDDENLVERPCISCGLLYILDKTDKCENCNPESFATARLAKQTAIMDYLDVRGLTGDSTDRIVDGGVCGKERPDRIYDFGDLITIFECDENQHDDRPCLCEQTRMVNIGQSFGGIPVCFVRFNPDDYSPANPRSNPELLAKRHKLCGDLIQDIKNKKVVLPNALVSVIYLYYDGWSNLASAQWEIVSPLESSNTNTNTNTNRITHV